MTPSERAEWAALREREAEAEKAGAPHGRCQNENYDEPLPDRRPGPQPGHAICGAALILARIEGAFCVSCLWRDVQEYGSDG